MTAGGSAALCQDTKSLRNRTRAPQQTRLNGETFSGLGRKKPAERKSDQNNSKRRKYKHPRGRVRAVWLLY
jgi:hypothetical protein